MNFWVFSAGILGLFTFFVHLIAGQFDPVKPFLKSDLAELPKATLLACWHLVSVTLFVFSVSLAYIGWENIESLDIYVLIVSYCFVAFSLVFLCVGWYFFGVKSVVKLPQWVLLLPIGVLGFVGAT